MDAKKDESGADPMIETTEAFLRDFRKEVAVNVPALLSSMELEQFAGKWTDTLLERSQECGTEDGSPWPVLLVLLNELAQCQIELSMRAGGYGQDK